MWDQRYSGADYVFGVEPNRFLTSCGHLLEPGQTALAVADGEGRNSVWLASQGLSVTAFDASNAGLSKARQLAAEKRALRLSALLSMVTAHRAERRILRRRNRRQRSVRASGS